MKHVTFSKDSGHPGNWAIWSNGRHVGRIERMRDGRYITWEDRWNDDGTAALEGVARSHGSLEEAIDEATLYFG